MFITKECKIGMENRIEELENILCPCGQHDWLKVDEYNGYNLWSGKMDNGTRYQCKRCLKKKYVPNDPIEFKEVQL